MEWRSSCLTGTGFPARCQDSTLKRDERRSRDWWSSFVGCHPSTSAATSIQVGCGQLIMVNLFRQWHRSRLPTLLWLSRRRLVSTFWSTSARRTASPWLGGTGFRPNPCALLLPAAFGTGRRVSRRNGPVEGRVGVLQPRRARTPTPPSGRSRPTQKGWIGRSAPLGPRSPW